MILCVSPPGTPVSDTACERCPAGHFSSGESSTEACQPHRNCSDLGLKTLRWGTSTSNSLCGPQDKCSQHHTLCHTGKTYTLKQSLITNMGDFRTNAEQGWFVQCIHRTHTHTCDNVFEQTSIVNNLKSAIAELFQTCGHFHS